MTASFTRSSCSSAVTSAEPGARPCRVTLDGADYDLAATLNSGQAFRWEERDGWWEGVIGRRWVRLKTETHPPGGEGTGEGNSIRSPRPCVLFAETATPVSDWRWLTGYLRWEEDLAAVLAGFPADAPMCEAVAACRGLRLLRQEPWECLASFILSSTKQIRQIRQIVARLCEQFGEQLAVPKGHGPVYSFPSAGRIAAAAEAELRACKMGFRAPNLRAAAGMVAAGAVDLDGLSARPLDEARAALMTLPGVGRKIADCVLLFGCGFPGAFPVDVWVMKALRRLYFPGRRVSLERLRQFAGGHFGPQAGYAQQYLFHYARVHVKLKH